MTNPKVFLDSSVVLAALLSSRGGSFYILSEMHENFDFKINEYIFSEVMEVIDKKFNRNQKMKNDLFALLSNTLVEIIANENKKYLLFLNKIINKKDSPILASAILSGNYLISLDGDFLNDKVVEFAKKKSLIILSPKDFIIKYSRKF